MNLSLLSRAFSLPRSATEKYLSEVRYTLRYRRVLHIKHCQENYLECLVMVCVCDEWQQCCRMLAGVLRFHDTFGASYKTDASIYAWCGASRLSASATGLEATSGWSTLDDRVFGDTRAKLPWSDSWIQTLGSKQPLFVCETHPYSSTSRGWKSQGCWTESQTVNQSWMVKNRLRFNRGLMDLSSRDYQFAVGCSS